MSHGLFTFEPYADMPWLESSQIIVKAANWKKAAGNYSSDFRYLLDRRSIFKPGCDHLCMSSVPWF